jgi:sortase (surface protein transpeptidase)
MKYSKPKLSIILGLLVLSFGVFIFLNRQQDTVDFPITTEIINDNVSIQDTVMTKEEDLENSSIPTRLQIKRLGIDLPVEKGYFNKNSRQWNISTTSAFWSVMTSKPNRSRGVTFIYGHNRGSVFSSLAKLEEGDSAVLYTDNGQQFNYRLKYSFTTKPEDTSIFNYNGLPILAVQTCSGATFQNRTIYVFEVIGNQNA